MKFDKSPLDEYLELSLKKRYEGRELGLISLVGQFTIENDCKASEVELVERSEWKGLSHEISWSVRKKVIDYSI